MKYSNKKIVIIGAGPAALSFAASLELAKLDYVILEKNDKVGGQLSLIHNELDDFVVGTYKDGKDFAEKVIRFNDKYKLNIKFNCQVQSLDISNKTIHFIHNNTDQIVAYDIAVIATGSRCNKADKSLTTSYEKDIYYRISHDLQDFKDKKVAVIGGGDNATIAALRLVDTGNNVLLINKNKSFNSRPDLISDVFRHNKIQIYNNCDLTKINGESGIRNIEVKDNKTKKLLKLDVDKIVFKIGYLPNTEIVSSALELDDKGYIKTNGKYMTNIKDVFAIGDVVSGAYKRISIVMGHGTDLGNYFLKEYLIDKK